MLRCTHCGRELVITPSGVAIDCGCALSRLDELKQREKRNNWHADREKAIQEERRKKDRNRRCGST